ncbi:hypothetical protein D3C87_1973210 [compost metagenome]
MTAKGGIEVEVEARSGQPVEDVPIGTALVEGADVAKRGAPIGHEGFELLLVQLHRRGDLL